MFLAPWMRTVLDLRIKRCCNDRNLKIDLYDHLIYEPKWTMYIVTHTVRDCVNPPLLINNATPSERIERSTSIVKINDVRYQ